MKVFAIFVIILLIIGSVYDWKYRGLPVWLLLVGGLGGLAGLIYAWCCTDQGIIRTGMALAPGAVALLLSYVTREQIGYGDGVLLLIMGGCLGRANVIAALFVALAVTCIIGITLLVSGKAKHSSRIPFVPFLCIGSIVVALGGWSG